MAGSENAFQLLVGLTGQTGQDEVQVYAKYAGLTIFEGNHELEQLVRRKLTTGGKTAQLRESLGATLRAGGAVGETVEEMLRKTGLLGWT